MSNKKLYNWVPARIRFGISSKHVNKLEFILNVSNKLIYIQKTINNFIKVNW